MTGVQTCALPILGFVVMITDALMGVVMFKPLKKKDWLIAIPNNPQMANFK